MLINPEKFQQASNDENSTFDDRLFISWGRLGRWNELDFNKIYYGTLSPDWGGGGDVFDPYVLKGGAGNYSVYLTSSFSNTMHIANPEAVSVWWGAAWPTFDLKAYVGGLDQIISYSSFDYDNGDRVLKLAATGDFSIVVGVDFFSGLAAGSNFGYGLVAVNEDPDLLQGVVESSLDLVVDRGILSEEAVLLKGLVEKVVYINGVVQSHAVEYGGVVFNYSDIDQLIMTVTRDGEFVDEFSREIADFLPAASGITYQQAVQLVGINAIDGVIVSVAGSDGSYVS